MTREQKIEMFTMKLDGATYSDIASKYDVSKQYVQQMLTGIISPRKILTNCVYPNIVIWMRKEELRVSDLADKLGIDKSALYNKLYGRNKFRIDEINQLVEMSGYKFEVLFYQKRVEGEDK